MSEANQTTGSFVMPQLLISALQQLPQILDISRALRQKLSQRIDDW